MAHFSKYIRPGAQVIETAHSDTSLLVTAAENPDGTIAVVVFNAETEPKAFEIILRAQTIPLQISAQALQTIVIQP